MFVCVLGTHSHTYIHTYINTYIHLSIQTLGWLLGGDHMGVTGDVQLVMMGSGEGRYTEFLQRAEAQNKVLRVYVYVCAELAAC